MHASPIKHRTAIGWITGLLTFLALMFGFERLGDKLGVPARIDLDEPVTITHSYGREEWEEEVSTLTTWYGQMTLYLAITLAVWAGYAAATLRLDGGWTARGWLTFAAWSGALTVLTVAAILSERVFPADGGRWMTALERCSSGVVTIGVAVGAHSWWKTRVAKLKPSPESDGTIL